MIKDSNIEYEILVFSDEWFGLPFSCKHLLKYFLPYCPIVWVETIGLRSPKFNLYDIERSIGKISGWFSPSRSSSSVLPKNLQIIDPIQIPYNHIDVVRKINKKIILRSVKRSQYEGTKRDRVLITTWPFMGDLVVCLGERLSIYYRVDDFSEFPGVRRDTILRLESELIKKVDMIVATSEQLTQVDTDAKMVYYLPHGVDFEHFSKKIAVKEAELPIQQIRSPRIGFFGLLSPWIDFDLLSRVASYEPDWSFIFIGPSQIPTSLIPKLPNMHFLGPVPYDELPKHAQYFDVGLIPFKVNALTLPVNPLKLMEYLSMGLPVVSTPLPEVMKFKDYVAIASEPEAFKDAIKAALNRDSPELHEMRKHIAQSRSWQEKSNQLRGWVEKALEQKIASSNL